MILRSNVDIFYVGKHTHKIRFANRSSSSSIVPVVHHPEWHCDADILTREKIEATIVFETEIVTLNISQA